MLTLHHFTSPLWFAMQGGFSAKSAPLKFQKYVQQIVKKLGSRVPLWCTLNEPMVLVVGTYLGKFMPPGEYSPEKAALACHHLLKAHVTAYHTVHSQISERKGPFSHYPIQVGIAHNLIDFMPDRVWHPLEFLLSHIFHRYYNQSWLDAITGKRQHFGVRGLLPYSKPVKEALGKRTVDFIGVNYYTKGYVQWQPRDASQEALAELPIGISFARRKEAASDLGWAIHPKGLQKILEFVSRYHLPIYITENGVADREDIHRPQYLASHLYEIAQAIENGIDIRGYYYWSLLDNFEWIKGFWPRFGLFHVDYDTLERIPTKSAKLYKKIINAHQNKSISSPRIELMKRSVESLKARDYRS